MGLVDLEKSRELKKLIESLTHSGSKDLNKEELNCIIEICSQEEYLSLFQDDVMKALKKNHSEVRYSAAQLCHEFFMKYEQFRNYLTKILNDFFSLTLGIESKTGLPPPQAAAKALNKVVLGNLLIWEKSFPIPKLKRAVKYLKEIKNIDFQTLEVVDPKERKEKEEWDLRMMKLNKERLKKMNSEIEDLMPDIIATLTSLESCFDILMPPPDDLEGVKTAVLSKEGDMRVHGIINSKLSVQIEIGNKIVIHENEENNALIDAAKEAFTLINNKFLPKIKAWVEVINKAEGGGNLMKKALDAKLKLEQALAKYNKLEIVKDSRGQKSEEEEFSTDSDLEEVPEFKQTSKEKTSEEIEFLSYSLGLSTKKEKEKVKHEKERKHPENVNLPIDEPTPGPSNARGSTNERKKKLLEVAPKVPFDVDLYHWEDEDLPTPTILAVNSEGARFWGGGASEDLQEIPVPDGAASLRTRVIEFVGNWEPVNHTCKAPLPSGKLCPRRDRVKCPLHGIIVERDDSGRILNPEDEEKVQKSKPRPGVPDWQDPKLLAEIKAQTGIDLKMPEKGKRNIKKKYPNLTDIKEMKNTAVNRLSKKVFNKKSLKRVAATLDKIDHKKHRDKFGDQFNYVHGS